MLSARCGVCDVLRRETRRAGVVTAAVGGLGVIASVESDVEAGHASDVL